MTVDYDHYAIRRDASTIAKFVARMASHREKLAHYQLVDGKGVKFPMPPSKNSKWPAYEAAGRIERTLGLTTHASSVPELTELLAVAMTAVL